MLPEVLEQRRCAAALRAGDEEADPWFRALRHRAIFAARLVPVNRTGTIRVATSGGPPACCARIYRRAISGAGRPWTKSQSAAAESPSDRQAFAAASISPRQCRRWLAKASL